MGEQVGGGNLQTDAAQLFLFVPIPAKVKKVGLLSIYKFSLLLSFHTFSVNAYFHSAPSPTALIFILRLLQQHFLS
jgi:hypothetical protein